MARLFHVATISFGLAFVVVTLFAEDSRSAYGNWPQWRGPLATGVAPDANPPVTWGEDRNIRWKVAVPGKGHSTPIVWGKRLFVTTAIPFGATLPPKPEMSPGAHDDLLVTRHHKFVVLAFNRADGQLLWQRSVRQELPREGGHATGSLASNSQVTDGERVFAFFGSRGLYCLTVDGKMQWQADLGQMQTKHGHGEGSSPALYGETLIINWDHRGQSFVVAFEKRTGKQLWRVSRDEVTEGSGALGIGGVLKRQERFKGKKVVAVVCGRNIDLEVFKKIIA